MAAKAMLDLRFRTLLTPVLVPVLYRTVVVLAVVVGGIAIVVAAVQAWWLGLIALVVAPMVVALVIVLARVGCELLWYVHEMHEYVGDIAGRFARLEGVVDELANDMPKLGFLRRGASNRERAATLDTSN